MNATEPPDLSHRFILPSDAPLLANLAALWAVDPTLARAIEALDGQPSYVLAPSRSGPPTLSMAPPEGGAVYLHSRFDPVDDAGKLIDGPAAADLSSFFIHGFGLGYHVQALFDRATKDAFLWVLEPDLLLLRTAFEAIDYSKMIGSGRVLFVTYADKASLFGRLMPHAPALVLGFESITHGPSVRLQPTFHQQLKQLTDEFASYCHTTISTLIMNSKRTAENVAANLPWYVAAPCASRLKDHYKGSPAIIVSAGPSLRKNKHLLKDAQGNAVIIAVQTTLQPLLEMGVEPNFVTSLDYHDICARFFERLPAGLKTELVAEPKASSRIFDLHPGPLTLLANEFAENLLAEMKLNKATLPSGATVAHLAYYVAEYLGCSPIIFVGQDLGFSDGLCYSPGTSYEDVWRPELSRFCTVEMKQWEQIVRDRNILRQVPDHQGRPTYTEERLFTYLQHFERDFAKATSRIIDATEGGVLKRGAESMKLIDALKQFCASPLPQPAPEHPGLRWERIGECAGSLRKRQDEAAQIELIGNQTLPLLLSIQEKLDDQQHVNRAIARIDALRSRVQGLSVCYGLIMQLTQSSELSRFKADRKISAANMEGIDLQRRQVERDIENVRAVTAAAGEFRKLVHSVLQRMESFAIPSASGRKTAGLLEAA
jgi:hypothetical protein